MGLDAGARLGPYQIQSALGAGGMGEVYKARDTRLARTVAVKVLPAHVAADPHEFAYSWGNDGRALVFADCRVPTVGLCDVSLLSMDRSREATVLVQTAFNEVFPSVSPDGRWLAHESNASGRPEIYVRPFPDAGSRQWQVSTGGGSEPLWSSDGKELFYRGPAQLMGVAIESGATPRLGKPQALFNLGRYTVSSGRDYHITPEADRFLFAAPIATEGTHIVVVQNWIQELQRLVPTN